MTQSVIIVGAGASGIAAATKLYENGFQNLTILEAQNRIGGRVHTVPFGDNVLDMGAQWCHGEVGNVIYEMAKNLDLLQTTKGPSDGFEYRYSNGETADKSLTSKLEKLALEIADDAEAYKKYEGSFGNFIIGRFYITLIF